MNLAPAYNAWYTHVTAGVTPETLRIYKIRRQLLTGYLKHCGALRGTVGELSPFGYAEYLKSYSVNYRSMQLRYVRIFFTWCVKQGYIERNPCLDQRLQWQRKKYIALNSRELARMRAYKPPSTTLEKVRDMYIFQCYTGMAYCDMIRFSRAWLRGDWMEYIRRKTKTDAIVPIFKAVWELIEKYDGNMRLMTRERYNIYIKQLAALLGIQKRLTSHTARKTCGRWLLNKGMSIEVVSRILGHNDIKITQADYAHVDEERVLYEAAQVKANENADWQQPPRPVHDVFNLNGFHGHAHSAGNGGIAHAAGNVDAVQVLYNAHAEPVAVYYNGIFQPLAVHNGINAHLGNGKGIGNGDGVNPNQLGMFGNEPGQPALG